MPNPLKTLNKLKNENCLQMLILKWQVLNYNSMTVMFTCKLSINAFVGKSLLKFVAEWKSV